MQRYIQTVCALRSLAFVVITLLISNADKSFAQKQYEADQRSSADSLERAKTERDPTNKRSILPQCGVDSNSTLPTERSTSAFHTTSRPTPPPPPPITPVLGPQSTLFILFNFLDNQITPIAPEEMYAAAFTSERGIANFFAATSYGKISITGDVAGWFTIPYNENQTCNVGNWRNAARAAASAAGFDLTRYAHFVYIWPQNNPSTGVQSYGCGWAGFNGGSDTYINAWVNPNGFFYDGYQGHPSDNLIATICHEFGHGLGIREHASTLRCADGRKTIDAYSNCQYLATADSDDVMSYQTPAHELNAPHRAALGWFDPGQIQEVNADGTYTISPLEYGDSNVKALTIKKADTNESYYLSYRLLVGPFDSHISGANGTSIHTWDGYTASATHALYALPWTAANYNSPRPSALIDGMRFEDPINGVQITQVSHDANGVILSIRFGRISCQNYNPLVSALQPGGTSWANAEYLSQPYNLVVFNNNCVTCSASAFNLSSAGPPGWSTLYSGSVQTIQAQSYVLLNDQVQTSAGSAAGDYLFTVTATRADAPAYTASANGTIRVTTTDVTPPTAPADLTASADSTSVWLSWTASVDNVGVISYSIMRNDITVGGSAFFNTTSTSYVDPGTDPNHVYSYTVYARDATGLQSRTAVVKVSANLPVIDIIDPVDGTRVSGTVSVTARAASGRGVSKVELYVDNRLTSTSTVPPFTTSWNTRKVASGRHGLQCKVYDTVANVGVSGVVSVNK